MIVLVILAAQDWKERQVSVLLLMAFALLVITSRILVIPISQWLAESGWNLLLLATQLGLTWLYFKLRFGKKDQGLFQLLGAGDVVFLAVLATALPTISFMVMLVVGCLVAVVTHIAVIKLFPKQNKGIPLITYWLPVFCVFYFTEWIPGFSTSLNSLIVG